jgi:hypothetical protein
MRWRRGWGMRRGWGGWPGGYGGWGRWGGWGWRRRGFGCMPCCSLILMLPLMAFLAVVVTLAVHYL